MSFLVETFYVNSTILTMDARNVFKITAKVPVIEIVNITSSRQSKT